MKSIRSFLIGTVIIGSLVAGLHFLHAQTAVVGGFNGNISTIQSLAPDSIVQVTADANGLTLLSPNQIPRFGTFWVILPGYNGGVLPPYPCLPFNQSLPTYALANGSFLVDATVGSQAALNTPQAVQQAAMEAQASAVVNLITQVQATQLQTFSRAMGMDAPFPGGGGGGGGGFYSDSFNYTIPTNGLWLQITNVANGLAYLNLNDATDSVYEILSKTDLTLTNWNIETELWPTDTNSMPFTVSESGRTNLFIWAQDWTGVTENGNTTPDWWFWEYFGTLGLSDTNLNSQGNHTLLYDYMYGFDPNVIEFSLQFPDHATTSTIVGSIMLWSGEPFYYALSVNDTNVADAVWQPYAGTNITATLGATNGTYTVSVGLRGRAPGEAPLWEWTTVILDAPPLFLVVTNPPSGVVTKPVIQLQGFASEGLSNLTFDVSNAMGVLANQPGFIGGQYYDTNLLEFTTNYFQCYDVPLTNGLNTVTLHATFSTGQTVTTNIGITLDYSNDVAPVMNLTWPQDGTIIGGSTFTLRGVLNDDTASVSVSGLAGGPVTGKVGRDGQFWVENLPLASGGNTLTVTATDAAGNSSVTNITVVQTNVTITINPFSDDDLRQATVSVTGNISDSSFAISVNGTSAHYIDDEGDWEADGVAVNGSGIAAFDVVADPPGDPNIEQSLVEEMPSVVQVSSYLYEDYSHNVSVHFCDGLVTPSGYLDDYSWMLGSADAPPAPPWTEDSESDSYNYFVTDAEDSHCNGTGSVSGSSKLVDATAIELVAAGQPQSGEQRLVLLTAQANDMDGNPMSPESMSILGQSLTPVATNDDGSISGQALVSVPAGSVQGITPLLPTNGTFTVQPQDVKLVSQCVATNPIDQSRTNLGVGEQVSLYFNQILPTTNITWNATAGSLSVTSGVTNPFTAPSMATNVIVTATIGSVPVNLYFKVYAPSIETSVISSTDSIPAGVEGAGMHLLITYGPTNVSLANVQIIELTVPATNVTGYFTNFPIDGLKHIPNPNWTTLSAFNQTSDHASISNFPSPWYPGGLDWSIPVQWMVVGGNTTNNLPTNEIQSFSITDTNGTTTVSKLGSSVTRTP